MVYSLQDTDDTDEQLGKIVDYGMCAAAPMSMAIYYGAAAGVRRPSPHVHVFVNFGAHGILLLVLVLDASCRLECSP